MKKYRRLLKGEIIKEGDEVDMANDFDNDAIWMETICAGEKAPDPRFPAHRQYRREIENE